MTKSLSAIASGDGKFVIEEVTLADPQADEVLVKMKAAGLCHTDYDSLSWGKPIVMGHEWSYWREDVKKTLRFFDASCRDRS